MDHVFDDVLMDTSGKVQITARLISTKMTNGPKVIKLDHGEYEYRTYLSSQLLLTISTQCEEILELIVMINGLAYFANERYGRGAILHPSTFSATTLSFYWSDSVMRRGRIMVGTIVREFDLLKDYPAHCAIDLLFYRVEPLKKEMKFRQNPTLYKPKHPFDYDSFLTIKTVLSEQAVR